MTCPYCAYEAIDFWESTNLGMRKEGFYTANSPLYACPECGKTFILVAQE